MSRTERSLNSLSGYKEALYTNLSEVRLFAAAALVALVAINCAPSAAPPPPAAKTEVGPKPPLPLPPSPTPRPLPTVVAPAGSTGGVKVAEGSNERGSTISTDVIFARNSQGFIVEIGKDQKTKWESSVPGIPLAADNERLVALMSTDNLIHIFDTKTKKEIGKVESEYPLPQDKLPSQYKETPKIFGNLIVIPHGETIMGTNDGFAVYDKNTASKLWSTPKNAPYDFLDATSDTIIAGNRNRALTLFAQDGRLIAEIPASRNKNNQWVWNKIGDTILTVENEKPNQNGVINSKLWVHTTTGREIARKEFIPGWTTYFIRQPNIPVCESLCKPIEHISINRYPIRGDSGEVKYFISLEVDKDNKGWGYFFFFWNPKESTLQATAGGDFLVTTDRYIEEGKEGVASYYYVNSTITGYPYMRMPYTQDIRGLGKKRYLALRPWNWPQTAESWSIYNDVEGLEMVGKVGENFIFTNWNRQSGEKVPGTYKIYGINPDKNRQAPIWVWDSRRDSKNTAPLQLIIKENGIFVFGESLLKLNPATGDPELKGVVDGKIKAVVDMGNIALVETTDSRFLFYPLS